MADIVPGYGPVVVKHPPRDVPAEYHVLGSDPVADFRHKARYEAFKLVYRGLVLDVGCGSGYGTEIIRESPLVRSVLGIDRHVNDHPDCVDGDFLAEMFRLQYDTIVMIEFIEHLTQPNQWRAVKKAKDLLVPGGHLCVSTPLVAKSGPSETNPHHLWEVSYESLQFLLCSHMSATIWTYPAQTYTDGVSTECMCAIARKT